MSNIETALIVGVTSQDGRFLAKHLLSKGISVTGTSRRNTLAMPGIKTLCVEPTNYNEIEKVIETLMPDSIFMLAAESSVSGSFENPHRCLDCNPKIVLNILEAIRVKATKTRVMNACSSEVFGSTSEKLTSKNKFNPISPYALSKAISAKYVETYRTLFDIYAVNLFLFNHESQYRSENFVTKKIVSFVNDTFRHGTDKKLYLGNLDISRDWGLAEEYVVPMLLALQSEVPNDSVICTGVSIKLREFVNYAFSFRGLNADDYVEVNSKFKRMNEATLVVGDPNEAYDKFNWRASTSGFDVIRNLMECES